MGILNFYHTKKGEEREKGGLGRHGYEKNYIYKKVLTKMYKSGIITVSKVDIKSRKARDSRVSVV